jgi:hypothetical protein
MIAILYSYPVLSDSYQVEGTRMQAAIQDSYLWCAVKNSISIGLIMRDYKALFTPVLHNSCTARELQATQDRARRGHCDQADRAVCDHAACECATSERTV